jgi:hypothetical protein
MSQGSFLPAAADWRMAPVWNAATAGKAERPAQARERLWASELGRPNIDLFLKMRGVEATNPPNDRSKRKFEAGIMFEWIVGLVLKRAGILKENQTWVGYQYPNLLEVSGKIDYIAGGIPDYEHFRANLEALELPDFFMRTSQAVMDHFMSRYPEGLGELFLEIKSCSSFMMDSMERTHRSSQNHRLQLFHYLKARNHPHGNVVYVCRDDLRMLEVPVSLDDEQTENEYRSTIEGITVFYERHKKTPLDSFLIKPDSTDTLKWNYNPDGVEGLPPLEPFILWDKDLAKFARNWGVEYSGYLTMLYGFQTQLEFEEVVMPVVARWNRVLGRIKKGDKMTPKNLEAIEEMRREGFKVEELASQFAGNGEESEE